MTVERTILVLGRGINGWHGLGINFSTSGGDLEPRKWWAGGMTKGYLEQCAEGALVYDAEESDLDAFSRHVIGGPMVEPSLEPDQVERWSDPMPGREFSALDYVGVGVYESLLRQVPGVKIGHVHNGQIVWEA